MPHDPMIFESSSNDNKIPSPSPEAVQSIIEVMEFLEKGDHEMALRVLEGCFTIVSPRMIAADKLRFLNDAIASGKKEVAMPPHTMEFDWVHYADAALKLNMVDQIRNHELLEAIEMARRSKDAIDRSIELEARYATFTKSRLAQP